ISQQDYYRMAAIFAGSEDREIPIVSQMGIYEYTRYVTRLLIADQLKAKVMRMGGGRKRKGDAEYAPARPAEKDERASMLRQLGDAYVKAPLRYPTANVLVHSEIVPDTHILVRGDFKQKGPKAEPGFLSALGGGAVSEPVEHPFVPQRRKALAQWMTSNGQS